MAIRPLFFLGILLGYSSFSIAQSNFLLNETFEHNAHRWPELQAQNVILEVKNGQYLIQNNGASDVIAEKAIMLDETRDFTLRCSFLQDRGMAKSRFGLVWGMKNYQEYHAFEISPLGQFAVYSNNLGEFVMSKAWTDEASILGKGATNRLEIRKKNNDLTFLINGQQVYFRAADRFYGSKLGFIVSAGVTIRVDELVIEQESLPISVANQDQYPDPKERLGEGVNTSYLEERPILADQGKTLFFVRAGHPENNGLRKRMDVWMSKMQENGAWGKAEPVGALNSDHDDYLIGFSPDGTQLMVGSTEWSPTAFNVSLRLLQGREAAWSNPQAVSVPDFYANTPEASYSLSSDGKALLLSIDRDDSFGGRDLYVSRRDADGNWVAPVNLGKSINTGADELSGFLSNDGKSLYFATQGWPGYGGSDIFVSERLDDTWVRWSEPRNLGPSVNTVGEEHHFFLPSDSEYAYFASSDGAKGEGDLYRVRIHGASTEPVAANQAHDDSLLSETVPPVVPAEPVKVALWSAQGQVWNPFTKQGIEASVRAIPTSLGGVTGAVATNPQGLFTLPVPMGDSYQIVAEKPGYLGLPVTVQAGEELPPLDLLPLSDERLFQMDELLFDVSKNELSETGKASLDHLAALLMRHPKLQLEVAGHTDNTGLESTNLLLSQNRANAVVQYLHSKGISTNRLVAAGFGASRPVSGNDTEVGRRENRRVDFRILQD